MPGSAQKVMENGRPGAGNAVGVVLVLLAVKLVPIRIRRQLKGRIIGGPHISGGNEDLRDAGNRPERKRNIPGVDHRLRRQSDFAGRQRAVELDDDVQLVFLNHLHDDPPHQLTELYPLGNALASGQRVANIPELLPVFEVGPLVVAPELGARIERSPIVEGLRVAALGPVLGAPRQVLRHMESKGSGGRAGEDAAQRQVGRRRLQSLRPSQHPVDRL